MRRSVLVIVTTLVALACAPAAGAQKRQKDPVLEQFLREEFGQVAARLAQLSDRLTALEAEIAKVKQQQNDFSNELRNAQNVLKTTDTTLSTFRLSSQQDMFSLKTDLAQVRNDLTSISNLVRSSAAPAPATASSAPAPPAIEGYITEVTDKEVTINLGSNAGVREGTRFGVYRATDPRTQIGIIEVRLVLDANNSKAEIIYRKPEIRFEFSDIVRQM